MIQINYSFAFGWYQDFCSFALYILLIRAVIVKLAMCAILCKQDQKISEDSEASANVCIRIVHKTGAITYKARKKNFKGRTYNH